MSPSPPASTPMPPAPMPAPLPAIEPLRLLYVTNGSLLTADRWWQAHHYYQHRQNLHYQSLHQPGIVCGLGVRTIPAPETLPSELRDSRWVEIQPGIAIDLVGNPIVVDTPMTFRITSEVITEPVTEPITVYVVAAYVDPQSKQWSGMPADIVKEDFRINERITPPGPEEVELCRITLTSNDEPLQNAANVMHPGPQELDLRWRQRVQTRSQPLVQVGLIGQNQQAPLRDRWEALAQSVGGLYLPLAGAITIHLLSLTGSESRNGSEMTLMAVSYADAIALSEAERERLQTYLNRGGTLLIEYADAQAGRTPLCNLQAVKAELQTALADLKDVDASSDLNRMRQNLMDELIACEAALQEQFHVIVQPIRQWAQTTLSPASDHQASSSTLTRTPFLFDALPELPSGPMHLLTWGSVVLVIGSLSAAWTRQQFDQPLPRSTLRSAQELGINILYEASRRQQMAQAQQPTASEVDPL